jgi:hypothetical protein
MGFRPVMSPPPYRATRAELRAIDEGLREEPRSVALIRAESRLVGKRTARKFARLRVPLKTRFAGG